MISVLMLSNFSYSQKSISGIISDEFKTKNGIIKITRTQHLPKGKIISGTVVAEPDSEKVKKREKQKQQLTALILKVGEQEISANGPFSIQLPETNQVPMQVFDGQDLLGEIPLYLNEPIVNMPLNMPETLQIDKIDKISGDLQGKLEDADFLLDDKPLEVLASNESELYFKPTDIEPGKNSLTIKNQDNTIETEVNVIDYALNAGKLNLTRGETTYLDIQVVGLEGLQIPLQLEIKNQSIGTIDLVGGDIQAIDILPDEVSQTGKWNRRFEIQSQKSGGFSVYTDLQPAEKPITLTVEENVTIDFIDSYYARFHIEGLAFTDANRLLNFDNEKILMLLIPDENNLEETIWVQLDSSKKEWGKLSEEDIMALGTEFMDYCSRFSPPCPPGCKGHNPMYGTGLVIPDDSCIPSGIYR